jgi:Transglycosylase SLT domain
MRAMRAMRPRARPFRKVPLLGQGAPGELVLSSIETRTPVWVPGTGRMRGFGQYSPPSYFDTGWASVFVAGCESIGADPSDVAGLIIGESGWNPGAQNSVGCVGLNQICPVSYGVFSGDYSVSDYLGLSVSDQLPYAFAYWQQVMGNAGVSSVSGAELYWLNWVPALFVPNSSNSYVIQSSSDPYYDASLDIGNKGYITLGDLETRIQNMQSNNPDLWSYLQGQILLAGGIFPSTTTMVVGGVIAGFLGYFAWQHWKNRAA